MLRNYFTVALRNLLRRRGYAFINIFGLAIGIACCLLIALYVRQEFRADRFHANAERIYRVVRDVAARDEAFKTAWMMPVLAPTMEAEMPEVEAAVRVSNQNSTRLLRYGDRSFDVDDLLTVDAAFFRVFSFELQRGDPATALEAPDGIVLTESTARRLFGDEDPLGKRVVADNTDELTVTGIAADPPLASHLRFNGLLPFSAWAREQEARGSNALTNWSYSSLVMYALLAPGAAWQEAEERLQRLGTHYMADLERDRGFRTTLRLEPLADVRLRSEYNGLGSTGRIRGMYVLVLVAAFILGIACVNFTNLTTARSAERAKEVGVRKSLGAHRSALAVQFLSEAVLMSAAAFVLALALAQAAQPFFEALTGRPVAWHLSGPDLAALAGAVVALGLGAGFYPAVVLSRFQPARVLKGSAASSGHRSRLRQALVAAQFTIALGLIAATAVVFRQLDYMQRQDLGFDMHAGGELLVLDLPRDGSLRDRIDLARTRFLAHPDVLGAAVSATSPGDGNYWGVGGDLEREDGTMQPFAAQLYVMDEHFADVYGLDLLAGRSFSEARGTDSTGAFLLNETALERFGFTSAETALGRRIDFWEMQGEVVGVVRDFHASGLQSAIEPMVLSMRPASPYLLTLRLRAGDVQRTVGELEAIWKGLSPNWPFTYRFFDERFHAQYEDEVRFGRLFGTFAGLAILIACLGLFGLAAFTVGQRTKEIGIRKVLGATVAEIVLLLSKDVVWLVLAASVVAVPVVYLAMSRWLEDFAYRTDVGAGVFLLAGLTVLAVALLTFGVQAARAALQNPVRALRSE